jgi:polysaccharide export outer membrane protein
VDIASILRGDRPDFPLAPGDIVFIPQTILGGWNDVISQISPTFSVASSVLEPFVQIEFLEEQAQ